MTLSEELFNDIILKFTKNYTPFRNKCGICVEEKKFIGHCKAYKNLPSAYDHIIKTHAKEKRYRIMIREIIEIYNAIHRGIELGIISSENYVHNHTTSSSSLVYNGRPVTRRDVWYRLVDIADLIQRQSNSYPYFKSKQLKGLIQVVIGKRDPRVIDRYFDCVVKASIKDLRRGTFDVRKFVECTKVRR